MPNNETLGASFGIDITDLKAGINQANRLIRESESEFRAAAAGMDDWTQSEEGLSAKISSLNNITDIQRKKVNALQAEYDRLVSEGLDPASREATELRTKINNETAALNKNEKELKKQTQALEELGKETDETSESTDDLGGSFEGLKGAGGIAVKAVAAVAAACIAAVGAFLGLAESTRESRNEMAKLETAFASAELSAQDAEDTFTELFGILGDEGRAVETASFLAKYADDEKQLAEQTRILTGVFAEYGESIPTEGLAEGIAATIAMSETQGVLADALEWQGVNLDEFNAKLAACADEQEREALITATLNELYGESADRYKEVNADIIASQEAQAGLNQALNDLGAIAEPIMTTIKTLATDLLETITPFVELVGEGLTGALEGADGAADMLAEGLTGIVTSLLDRIIEMIPFVIETIVSIVPQLISALLAQLPTILNALITMVVQVINALAAMLPDIVAAIMDVLPQLINSLIAAIPQLLEAAVQLLMAIVDAIPVIIVELLNALPSIIETIIEALLANIPILINAAIQLLMAIVDAIPVIIDALIENLPSIISTIISGIVEAYPQMIAGAVQLFMALVKAIPEIIPELVAAIPDIISAIVEGLIDGIPDITEVGKDIVEGLWEGITSMGDWLGEKLSSFGQDALDGLKDFFGIHSPSDVLADEVGKNMALGIGEGFEENIDDVNAELEDAFDFDNPNGKNPKRPRGGVTVNQNNYYSQAHSRYELYKSKQETAAAVRLAIAEG